MTSFYDDDYKFIPDYSSVCDYIFEPSTQIPQGYDGKIYHSIKNSMRIMGEPNIQGISNKFDKDKQKIIDYLVLETLKKHTIMIIRKIAGLPDGVASGIYVQYEGKEYIFTAGHTFSQFTLDELYLYLDTSYYISNCKGIIWTPCKKDDFHVLDYSIIYVDDLLKSELQKSNYVPFDITDSLKINHNGIYNFYYGYPASFNKANKYKKATNKKPLCFELEFDESLLQCKTLSDINSENTDIDYLDSSYNEYDKRLIETQDIGTKKTYNMPDLQGMSGCGIWRFKDYPFNEKKYFLEGMFLGDNDSHDKLYFDKLTSIIKYWNLLKSKIQDDKMNIDKMISFLPKKEQM